MKIVGITGNHPRHLFIYNRIHRHFPLSGLVLIQRESFVPAPPPGLAARDRANFKRHFRDRAAAERKYFGRQEPPATRILKVAEKAIGGNATVRLLRDVRPDVVVVFGCDVLQKKLLPLLPKLTLNLHLGLMPYYQGSAGLFWPFYFMEPYYAGSTFHYLSGTANAGKILHQVAPRLSASDGIHDVACKTLLASAEAAVRLLKTIEQRKGLKYAPPAPAGKYFYESDFKPRHLRVIYDVFKNDLAEQCLSGALGTGKPRLFDQFKRHRPNA
jgi:folate-dependent phosphoribosylglycinamide formyltransferase PurN